MAAAVATVLAVGWFYYWTVGSPRVFAGQQTDYYNLLLHGFRDGHLAMKATPDPWLGVDNTKVTSYLMDASFYHGKYYLYFGVTPVLFLFWPWAVVTGHDLPIGLAAMLLASLAYLLSIGWLRTLRNQICPEGGRGFHGWVAIALLGLAPAYPVVLRRPLFYEVAILSGLVCTFGGLWCLTLALTRGRKRHWWLAGGSLLAGLAAGSRPTLIPGALLAVALTAGMLGWQAWREGGRLDWRAGLRLVLAAILPAGICGAGLAWYNWARFDNPLDFGLLHQVAANGNGFPFTLGFLWKNLFVYYLTPPDVSWFFPFFAPGPKPFGSYQEQVHSQFYILPLFLLAAWRGVVALRRPRPDGGPRARIVVVALAWALPAFVFVGMCWAHANRYLLDFHPVFVVLTLLGLFACAGSSPGWRRLANGAMVWSGWVMLFNLCTSFHVHGFFRDAHPQQYEALARVADRVVWPLQRLAGPRFGGVEAVVKFPHGTPGTVEPLLVAGGGDELDALLVRYAEAGRGRIVYIHLGQGTVESDDFDLQEGNARWLKIQMGTLYPPAWHPWYDALPPGMARARNHVSVEIDGETILNRDVACYEASANQVHLGRRGGFPIGGERFGGEIARVKGLKADATWLKTLQGEDGRFQLELQLPQDRYGAEEPLVFTGRRGAGDLVSVTYVRPGIVRFSAYHDGLPAPESSPDLVWNYRETLQVTISLDSLQSGSNPRPTGPGGGVTVEADGRVVLTRTLPAHPAKPTEVYVGCLPWPVGPCRLMFAGSVRQEPPAAAGDVQLHRGRLTLLAGRPVAFEVSLPPRSVGLPLFTTGIVGRGDGLFLEYVSDTEVRLGFDHWGSKPLYSAPVPAQPGGTHRIAVSLGARVSRTSVTPGHLLVEVDGRTVLDAQVSLFPAVSDHVFFGANPIGMSTSRADFPGRFEFVPVRER